MPYVCELCRTERDPADRVCKVCGHKVGQRQASRLRGRQRISGILGVCVVAALVSAAGWAASGFWMRGPGGQISFAQHNQAGNAAFQRGNFTDADTEYSAMIELRPRRVDGYLLRAINADKAGRYPQAIRDNTAALALNPPPLMSATLYFNRAEAYSSHREWGKAIADFMASEQAYQHADKEGDGYAQDREQIPDCLADVRRGRARANLQLKRCALTVADYSANIKAGNVLPEDYGMRATAEEGLGHDAEAIAGYGQSLCVDPAYQYAVVGIDRVAARSHLYAQAARVYRQVTQAHPENVLCLGGRGWCEYMAGQITDAIATDKQALSMDPHQDWIRFNLGLAHAVAGNSVEAHQAYALALEGQGPSDRPAALKEIQQALLRHPNSPALKAAIQQMQTALATAPHKPVASTAGDAFLPAPRVAPTFERLLDADTMRRGYKIRPPAGYTLKPGETVTLGGTHDVDYWQGASRPDGSAPNLQVEIISDDGRLAAQSSPKQKVQEYLAGLADNHTQLKVSAITPCTLSQRTFMKATWSGVGAKTGKPFQGFIYLASQTGEYICIVAHDTVPDSATSLPLLEASVNTFRK